MIELANKNVQANKFLPYGSPSDKAVPYQKGSSRYVAIVVAHACNSSTWQVSARRVEVQGLYLNLVS